MPFFFCYSVTIPVTLYDPEYTGFSNKEENKHTHSLTHKPNDGKMKNKFVGLCGTDAVIL